MITISIDNRTNEDLPVEDYRACAQFVLERQNVPDNAELSLSLIDVDEMRQLNFQYRGIDEPTDVLAFECDGTLVDGFENAGEAFFGDVFLLGDVVIAPAVAREHALSFDSSFAQEMYLMLIHGILHLLGYDHTFDDDYEKMTALENDLLTAFNKGIPELGLL